MAPSRAIGVKSVSGSMPGFAIELRRDAERRHRRNQQRVAVGFGARDRLGADQRAGAGSLSTTTGLPNCVCNCSPIMRPSMSGIEPAG